MGSSLKLQGAELRYGSYIEELHEFFATRKLHFGRSQDIFPLAERLSNPGFFREEMSSMVRAIVYREQEAISRVELLELIAFAIGGPDLDQNSDDFREPIRQILDFVSGALRTLWRPFPDETSEAEEHGDDNAHAPESPLLVCEEAFANVTKQDPACSTEAEYVPAVNSAPEHDSGINTVYKQTNSALSRALHLSGYATAEPAKVKPRISRDSRAAARIAFGSAVVAVVVAGLALRQRIATYVTSEAGAPARPNVASISPTLTGPYDAPPDSTEGSTPASSQNAGAVDDLRDWRGSVSGTPTSLPKPSSHQGVRLFLSRDDHANVDSSESSEIHGSPNSSREASANEEDEKLEYSGDSQPPAIASQGVFFVSSGLMTGNLLAAPEPHYPRLARLMHVEGPVILQVVVAPDGTVSAMRVLRGHWLLREAAEDAIRHWRYQPYVIDGRSTDIATIVTVKFLLQH